VAQSSRNRDVDRAAQQWARRIKLCPGSPGSGILPMNLKS
jgi:outer membrane biosynthesis protein TonB